MPLNRPQTLVSRAWVAKPTVGRRFLEVLILSASEGAQHSITKILQIPVPHRSRLVPGLAMDTNRPQPRDGVSLWFLGGTQTAPFGMTIRPGRLAFELSGRSRIPRTLENKKWETSLARFADPLIMKEARQLSISLASMCRTWSCPPKNTARIRTVSFSASTSNQ